MLDERSPRALMRNGQPDHQSYQYTGSYTPPPPARPAKRSVGSACLQMLDEAGHRGGGAVNDNNGNPTARGTGVIVHSRRHT